MKLRKWLIASGVTALTAPVAAPGAPFFSSIGADYSMGFLDTAHADVYHASEAGETLASVATRYGVRAETLRTLNRLNDLADDAALPRMLLRVPDGKESWPKNGGTAGNSPGGAATRGMGSSATEIPAAGHGIVAKSVVYVVQAGDTLDSIAARYSQGGHSVTADAIRLKNNLTGEPTAGHRLMVPLQSMTYRAPQPAVTSFMSAAQRGTPRSSPRGGATGGGAQVSDEMWLPTAREVPQPPPLYQTPNGLPRPGTKSGASKARRGPTALGSRSYFPSPNLDGARILGQSEDAPVVGSTPQPRVRSGMASGAARPAPLARVAQVAHGGARICRLPEARAATLYRCATGTEIAVTKQSGIWSAVLMSDRSTGWMPTKYLRFTGASVDISSQVMTGASERGDSYGIVDGRFTSNHPIVAQALTWLGTRYVYGGRSRRGIDCSALVQTSYRAVGLRLPRTAAEQSRIGTLVNPANLQPGDRLYFSASGTRVDHTGLYMGDGLFVHASGSGRAVMISRLGDRRNWNIFVWARR